MIFNDYVSMLAAVLKSDIVYEYLLPLICVAFVATIPYILRAMFRG